jgi:hypothetical protein
LLGALAMTATAVAVTLSHAPSTVVGTNAVPLETDLGQTKGAAICQAGETLPSETSAIRLSLEAVIGPAVKVYVLAGKRVLTSGSRGSGWTASSMTVHVKPLAHAASKLTLCFVVSRTRIHVDLLGAQTGPEMAARLLGERRLPGRIRAEYLRAGHASWWSLLLPVARRMGLGRAVAGTWIALLVLLAMLLLTLVVSWLICRELEMSGHSSPARSEPRVRVRRIVRRVPAAAWTCALVALLNAACWSVITPPFQVPDEPSHFAYVQLLAENGQLPQPNLAESSPAMQIVSQDLRSEEVRYAPQHSSLRSAARQRTLERDMAAPLSRRGPGGAGAADSEPPLYYALEAIPYELGSHGSLLQSLELMRLLSALMAAATALLAYMFVREALPGARWAWTVGGLAVALFPLLGFISGGVNPDAMLFAICAALYYCLARGFRRGLTRRLALAIGLLTAIGFLTKLNFVGFAPGVLLALVLLAVRSSTRDRAAATAGPAASRRPWVIGLALAGTPVLAYGLVNALSNHPLLGEASRTIAATHGSISHQVSYMWQFFLPRLPGMPNYFPGISTTVQLWFDGLVGMYGWADTLFPGWVYDLAVIPAGVIAALCIREVIRGRAALGGRIPEIISYLVTAAGVIAVVGAQSYLSDALEHFEPFWEPRYLLPVLALWGLVVTLAARGAGRRWGPVVGTLLIGLFLTHDVVSQLQVIARYYG